jgi:hypothetical protein
VLNQRGRDGCVETGGMRRVVHWRGRCREGGNKEGRVDGVETAVPRRRKPDGWGRDGGNQDGRVETAASRGWKRGGWSRDAETRRPGRE